MSEDINRLDEKALAAYLEAVMPGFNGPLSAKKFPGGQSNPTYLIHSDSKEYVLRRKPPGKLLPSAHAVDREFRVLQALFDSAVPVARPYLLCEDDSVIGSMFYIMSFEPGRIFWDPALLNLDQAARAPLYGELIRVLAALHDVDVKAAGLEDFGRPQGFYLRQLERWSKQYRSAETDRLNEMEQLMAWLAQNIPEDDGQVSLVHGDFRFDNVIFSVDQPHALAVLDWELSTLGHPFADLAYFCMALRLPRSHLISGLAGIDRAAEGLPSEDAIISAYCRHRHIDAIDHWPFYLAMSFFRLAAICQGVYKRALNGNASNEKALETGKMTRTLAVMALAVIRDEDV